MKMLAIFRQKPFYSPFCIQEARANLQQFTKASMVDLFPHDLKKHEKLATEHPQRINETFFPTFPLVYMNIDEETAKGMIDRSVLIKSFINIYCEGKDLAELKANITKNIHLIKDELDSTETFAFRVEPIDSTITQAEQVQKMESLEPELWFKGKVNLKNPKRIFWLIEDYENDHKGNQKLKRIYLGKLVAKSARGTLFFNEKYNLPSRAYLGPTSCDNDLAFLMANLGLVKQGDFVLDPFTGTGGLIIPSAHFGAIGFGGELDIRVLMGYSVGRYNAQSKYKLKEGKRANIWTNFEQYGLVKPEIMRMDTSRHCMRKSEFFDAIVCDPPYGIRAMVRESGMRDKQKKKKANLEAGQEATSDVSSETDSLTDELDELSSPEQPTKVPAKDDPNSKEETKEGESPSTPLTEEEKKAIEYKENFKPHYVPTKISTIQNIVDGLFRLGGDVLKIGGRIVFLYPVRQRKWTEADLPQNDQFKLVAYCENPMNRKMSRICVVVERKY